MPALRMQQAAEIGLPVHKTFGAVDGQVRDLLFREFSSDHRQGKHPHTFRSSLSFGLAILIRPKWRARSKRLSSIVSNRHGTFELAGAAGIAQGDMEIPRLPLVADGGKLVMRIDQAMARRSNNAEARQPDAERRQVCRRLLPRALDQSARLRFKPTRPCSRMTILATAFIWSEAGLCALQAAPDGGRTVLGFVYAGGFLNLAGGRSPGYTAEAVTAAWLRCCSRSELDELIDR